MCLRAGNESDSESSENVQGGGHISPETQQMYERISDFAPNDVFPSFREFNWATLELFKMMKKPMYNVKNWTKKNYKDWTDGYRSYCGNFWETYAGKEMCTGDLLDWWDIHQKDLINLMNFVLVGNHPEPVRMILEQVH